MSSSSSLLTNPLLEESTINPTSPLPSYLEMKLLDETLFSAHNALSTSIDALTQHLLRLQENDHHSNSQNGTNNYEILRRWKNYSVKMISKVFKHYSLEIQMLITYLLERKALTSLSNSTISEAMFGFRRSKISRGKFMKSLSKDDMIKAALLLSTGTYISRKMNQYYRQLKDLSESNIESSCNSPLLKLWKKSFLYLYPFLHMTKEGLNLAYNFRYMIHLSPYYNPSLHVLGQIVRRTTMHDTDQSSYTQKANRSSSTDFQKTLKRIRGPAAASLFALFFIGWVGQFRRELRHRRRRLISTVEEETEASSNDSSGVHRRESIITSKIPPPLPSITREQHEATYPTNPSVCPLCKQKRVNPTAATSGFVFCFRCIALYLREQDQKCPITGMKCSEAQLIRLYEPSG